MLMMNDDDENFIKETSLQNYKHNDKFFYFYHYCYKSNKLLEEVATPVVCCGGKATFGMPSGMGSVVSVPSGTGPMRRKPGAATLIRCRRGSLALMTHLGAWKLLDIGM